MDICAGSARRGEAQRDVDIIGGIVCAGCGTASVISRWVEIMALVIPKEQGTTASVCNMEQPAPPPDVGGSIFTY